MVAEMLSFGDNKHLEEGDGKVLPPDQKESPPESENSASEASTEGSSSEEEEEEEDEDDEGHTADSDEPGANDTSPELPADLGGGDKQDGVKLCCEKCKAIQKHNYELVTPRRISKDRLQLTLACEGTYECSVTGLVFEVSQRAHVKYRVLSWSKYGSFLKDRGSWKFAGPIFDVDCDPTILKSIQFPHSLCLADEDDDVTFSVLHVKDSKPQIEPSVDHSGSHIKWTVTSLSPVGPIVQTSRPAQHHGVVLVYKELGQQASYSFRVYLSPNNGSDIKDVQNAVRRANKKYVKMEKPPTCRRLLEERRKYRLTSEPVGDITPADFQFTLDVVKMKGYFEVFFEQPPPFKLSLMEVDSEQEVWTATIREGDCVDKQENEKPRRRAERRKRSTSTSEEELSNKRTRWADESDGVGPVKGTAGATDATDQQLMKLAKCMGKEWKQVGISYLGLTMQELDTQAVNEEDSTMHKFRMLEYWRRKRKGKAGLAELHRCLDQEDVPNKVRDCLEDMLGNGPK